VKSLILIFSIVFAWLFVPFQLAHAHKPSDSYLTFDASAAKPIVNIRWDIALRDLDFAIELDTDQNAELTWGEVHDAQDKIVSYALKHLIVKSGGSGCPIASIQPLQLDKHSDGTYAVLTLEATCSAIPKQGLEVDYTLFFNLDPTHRGLGLWQVSGKAISTAIFKPEQHQLSLAFAEPSWLEVLRDYGKDGVWHIWIGIDHILFLISLLLPAVMLRQNRQWIGVSSFKEASKDILKVVTAFTLAHSITLSLAALELVQLPSRIVEASIAFSVVIAALNNLRGAVHSKRWAMAFGFGLLHGFGFASVLADLGLPKQLLVLALVSFNLGVEAGQMAIVAAVMPMAYLIRRSAFYRLCILQGGSVIVAGLAAVWTVERALGQKWLPF
jgi:hypothetical protein